MSRNEKKIKLSHRMYDVMKDRPDLCGDDTHAVNILMLEMEFGIRLTPEQILFLDNVIRTRRTVLKAHPELDLRKQTVEVLAVEDAIFHAKRSDMTQGELF